VTRLAKYAVLAIPVIGLAELVAHFYFSHRAPTKAEWDEVRPLVASWYQPGEVVVVAPEWAEPMARWSFGDSLMPTRDVARPDATGYQRALEVAAMGSHSKELDGWKVVRETKRGRFALRELSNPSAPVVTYDFLDHVDPESADVRIVQGNNQTPCPFTTTATVESPGLGGPSTYPASRFACPGQPTYVFIGLTIIEDDRFRPRRCIWSHPPPAGAEMVVRFKDVPLGNEIRGHTGMRMVVVREGVSRVMFDVIVGGQSIGRAVHENEGYWKPFQFPLGASAGKRADVEFRVTAAQSGSPVCFEADSR
jgi:hypothetical protein